MDWAEFSDGAIYLDANPVIYAVEAGNPWTESLRRLFDLIDDGIVRALTSELTLAEVLAKPYEVGATALVDTYETLLAGSARFSVVPIDRPVLRLAAALRKELDLKMMDAIHVATASYWGCEFLLTNDDRLRRRIAPKIKCIDLWEIAGVERPAS